ncbi:LacI family DNA-binding transcriptional regulator [Leifsonia sp. ZF2019]|uniref:LacI family DNA-binding transcriptional regulator n=1 Tax=Leifsonia sp. ZF2019 TaxID=2781978 RepID=UPI001CBF4238|nr:LacI family DNA-binding transcriptional regulator [Leifsonia sp. ZF2019]UAJ80217.1 LacI family DNA-binding transcriptional regulator [Leifsonia sp. ZF2019]
MAATIGDVARAAGVSRSTVSYALSGKRMISDETRARIQAAIDDLGFTPNAGARALATAQTNVLGLYLQFQDDEFAPAMLQYVLPVSTTAREDGFDLLMVTDTDLVEAVRRTTSSRMVDGVVLLDVTYDDVRLEPLREAAQPAVLIGYARDSAGFDSYDLDFGEAARLAVDHLAALGHTELVLITPPRHVYERGGSYAWRFRDAAVDRAARYGIRISALYGDSRQPGIDTAFDAAFATAPTATGLIVHNDAMIAALPSYLHKRGVRAPDDLSVVGVYSRDFGQTFSLPYTAVETSPDRLGELAVRQLVTRIADPERAGAPIVRLIEPRLVDRGSTRPVA